MCALAPACRSWCGRRCCSAARLTKDGVLVITARRFREQERNRADARARLAELIRAAATPPKPRRATRIPKASKKRSAWRPRSAAAGIKQDRGRPSRRLKPSLPAAIRAIKIRRNRAL